MDRRVDIGISLAFIALGIFVIIVASQIPSGLHKDPVGPRAFFYGCAGVFILGGLFTLAQRAMSRRYETGNIVESEGSDDEPGQPASPLNAGLIILMTLVYTALLPSLGYLISTPIFIGAALVLLKVRRPLTVISIAVLFTLIAYLVFAQVLNVRLPVGPFTDFFREMGWIVL